LDRLAAEPLVIETVHPRSGKPGRVGIGKLDLQMLFGFLIKNPDTQAMLPMAIAAMDQGDFSAVAPYLLMFADFMGGMRGMPEAMDAASGISPERAARVRREASDTLLEDILNYPGPALAEALGVADLGEPFRAPLSSPVPALFLSGDRDGRTYVESHREAAAGFEHAVHVIVEGAGHDLFMASPEVGDRIATFLAGKPTSSAPIQAR
ncbi:MAG: alpha/beta hydrolase, partial [Acidobacteriota bacterium]